MPVLYVGYFYVHITVQSLVESLVYNGVTGGNTISKHKEQLVTHAMSQSVLRHLVLKSSEYGTWMRQGRTHLTVFMDGKPLREQDFHQ